MKQPEKNKLIEIKALLVRGDLTEIQRRLKEKHKKEVQLPVISRVLNPKYNCFDKFVYAEALKLAVERKNATPEIADLEAQL